MPGISFLLPAARRWLVEDLQGRKWKVVDDVSQISVPAHLREKLVRAILKACGKTNSRCGIHIHVGATSFDAGHLGNLAKIVSRHKLLIGLWIGDFGLRIMKTNQGMEKLTIPNPQSSI